MREEAAVVSPVVTTVMTVAMVSIGVVAVVVAVAMVTTVVVVSVDDHRGCDLLVDRNRHWHRDLMDNRGLRLVIHGLRLRLVIDGSLLLRIILLRWHRLRIPLRITLRSARGMVLRLHFFKIARSLFLSELLFYYIIIMLYF